MPSNKTLEFNKKLKNVSASRRKTDKTYLAVITHQMKEVKYL